MSVTPRCILDFSECDQFYSAQKNAWMDYEGFVAWLYTWYSSVLARSSGPWLLLLDKFSGHVELPNLDGVTLCFLSAKKTSAYQPMYQEIIQVLKNIYRTTLLRKYLYWLILSSTNLSCAATARKLPQGRVGVREGHTAHVVDSIRIENRACDTISNDIIFNCWKKRSCLGEGGH